MQFRQTKWFQSTILATTILGMLAATSQVLRADEMPIFGLIGNLGCQGAGDKSFPGFAVSTFSLSDQMAGRPSSKVYFADITVVKGLDDCTPLLFGAVATETLFPTVSLTVVPKGSKVPVLL